MRIRKTAPSNADKLRQSRYCPIQSCTAYFAKIPRLVVFLRRKMKSVNLHVALLLHDILAEKVCRNPKRTPSAPLTISAVANTLHFWLATHSDRCCATGALCCFIHIDTKEFSLKLHLALLVNVLFTGFHWNKSNTPPSRHQHHHPRNKHYAVHDVFKVCWL